MSTSARQGLPALRNNPKYIFFTDFDGTITLQDSNDFMIDNLGFGFQKRRAGNADVLFSRSSFRDSFRSMMDSIHTPFDKCMQILMENIKLDPGFKAFHQWARENNIPVVVLSSGMEPIIWALLVHLIGDEALDMQIVSNDVAPREGKCINEEGGWKIVFRDESHFGHDKSIEIQKYTNLTECERPIMFYAGDGVSDLSAAKETDLLFAKHGCDLVQYCVRENIPFIQFEDWSNIFSTVRDIVSGKMDVRHAVVAGPQECHAW